MNALAALAASVAVLVLATLLPWLKFVLTIAMAKGIAVLGILLLLRAGQVSFGHAMFVAFSAYIIAFAAPAAPDVFVMLVAGVLGAVVAGAIVGLFVARYRDIFFGMLNLAISMVFYAVLEKFYAITRGTDGIRVSALRFAGQELSPSAYGWAMLCLALVLCLAWGAFARLYLASAPGQGLSAIKTRETRLEFAGVSAKTTLFAAYVLSAAMAGTGGALVAMTSRHVTPLLSYWTASGELVFIAVLGGQASVFGPFLGAAAYELVRVYASAVFADAWQAILGAVLLLVILFAPGGIVGALMRRRAA